MGTGKAVTEITEDRRHELAQHLKLQALEEMNKRQGEREHGYAKERQGTQIEAEKEMSGAEIKSREGISATERGSAEKIASERNATLEKISKMELDMKERMLGADKKSTEAQMLRAKIDALTESRKIAEAGGSIDEINAPLRTAGLPEMEEYTIEEGSFGFLGIGSKEPVKGRRFKGSGGTDFASLGGAGQSQMQALLEEGKKSMPPGAQPPQKKKPGLISQAMADDQVATQIRDQQYQMTHAVIQGDYVYGQDKNGQTKKLFPVEEPTIIEGGKKVPNPKYQEYLEKIEKLGISVK
jgi:hypothetical protein